jgi:hypothetical protein
VQTWLLSEVEAPGGTSSPVVLHSAEARAVLIVLQPGQRLGDHEVKEAAWIVVVEGVVRLETDRGSADAGAATLVRFEPTERRSISSSTGARLLLLFAPWPGEGHYRAEEAAVGGV